MTTGVITLEREACMAVSKEQEVQQKMGVFFAEVQPQAYRMARAALRDHEQALDIVQDCMLRLYEKYSDKTPEDWRLLFFRIVTNRINDARRFRMLHQGKRVLMSAFSKNEHADSEDDIIDMLNQENVDSSSVQLESLASRQLNDKLESAMQILPMQQRQVFMLREWQGFSIKETAEILGCEIGTVKQHHYRALKALRQELAEFWDYANS